MLRYARLRELRRSWVTHLRAAGVDEANLADITRHSVETLRARFCHPTARAPSKCGG
jgi:hypothetical protein